MRKWPIVALAIVMAGAAAVSGLADVVEQGSWAIDCSTVMCTGGVSSSNAVLVFTKTKSESSVVVSFTPLGEPNPARKTFLVSIDNNQPIDLGEAGKLRLRDGGISLIVKERNATFERFVREMKAGDSIRVTIQNPSHSHFNLSLDGFARTWNRIDSGSQAVDFPLFPKGWVPSHR